MNANVNAHERTTTSGPATHALVAGGGIGGLAAALSLARRGHRVTVLERAEAFTEIGAGIQLAPNAFHALDRLGVGPAVRERAVFTAELRFMDGVTGETVATLPLTERYRRRFAGPYAVVHRADLYQPLLSACRAADGIELVTGAAVRAYAQQPSAVTVSTADGRSFTGDLLVGADGIRSAVRAQLVGDGAPRVCGHTIYRSVIPIGKVPEELRWNAVTLWAGPRWHFVHYVIGGGKYLNLAATLDDGAREPVAGRPAPRDLVHERFRELRGPARRLLHLGEEWREWVLCDRDPVDVWTDGRVTLLGDAAHPMLQYAAQGACQSLEDAVVLGELLGDATADDVPARLEKYNAERRERTARTQLLAREMGERLYHPAGEAARARNAMLRSLGEHDLYEHMAWLHGARPFCEETA
ncbi:3-hydroxybenzoate 6-monooxygenase [Streptomyces sp. NBC_00347]|uniref:3-hydroxybenzoate 6-monooxygenase n=1 Tax=Streptomyces sp. NBC_00347 TaxID=2975721 RepID=UPI00225028B1|nr:3-hydroxybenzoate 6-monooxygenase [Streptomyces sp. NBC_00347]MCX5127849.1 3-hydroxybenzoate 6-monooxygenase [Streptomyces sp. NBC_00347]